IPPHPVHPERNRPSPSYFVLTWSGILERYYSAIWLRISARRSFTPTPPLREGRNLQLRTCCRRSKFRGGVAAARQTPLPEKCFAFFDPPSRGGLERSRLAHVTARSIFTTEWHRRHLIVSIRRQCRSRAGLHRCTDRCRPPATRQRDCPGRR